MQITIFKLLFNIFLHLRGKNRFKTEWYDILFKYFKSPTFSTTCPTAQLVVHQALFPIKKRHEIFREFESHRRQYHRNRVSSQCAELTIVSSLKHKNTQPLYIFSRVRVLHLNRLKERTWLHSFGILGSWWMDPHGGALGKRILMYCLKISGKPTENRFQFRI